MPELNFDKWNHNAATEEYLKLSLEQWGHSKGILSQVEGQRKEVALAQLSKTIEEVAEVLQGLNSWDPEEIIDAYGDVMVTLYMGMLEMGIEPMAALSAAWMEIKDRQGKMVNGVFVKGTS